MQAARAIASAKSAANVMNSPTMKTATAVKSAPTVRSAVTTTPTRMGDGGTRRPGSDRGHPYEQEHSLDIHVGTSNPLNLRKA